MQAQHVLTMLKPLARRDFALVWVSRCLMYLGYTTVVNFMFFFLQDAVHYTQVFPGQTTAQGVNTFFAVNVVTIIIASLIAGIILGASHSFLPLFVLLAVGALIAAALIVPIKSVR